MRNRGRESEKKQKKKKSFWDKEKRKITTREKKRRTCDKILEWEGFIFILEWEFSIQELEIVVLKKRIYF